jgi:hypothetical protein
MNSTHCMLGPLRRWTLLPLAVAAALVSQVPLLRAQVQRQPSGGSSVQLDPNAVRAIVDPLKVEVQNLRAEVSRLHAALESLRLTVNANHAEYIKHRHGVASYGIVTAKSICPNTPANDGTMLVFTTSGGPAKGRTGIPE